MESDGVDSIDVRALPVAFEGEVLGLQAVLHMMHSHSPLNGSHLHDQDQHVAAPADCFGTWD